MMKNFLLLLSFETGFRLFYPPLSSSLHQILFLPSVLVLPWTFLWKNPACKPHTSCSRIFSPLPAASTRELLLRAVSFSHPGPHAHWFPSHTKNPEKDRLPWPIQFNQRHACLCHCWTRWRALSPMVQPGRQSPVCSSLLCNNEIQISHPKCRSLKTQMPAKMWNWGTYSLGIFTSFWWHAG